MTGAANGKITLAVTGASGFVGKAVLETASRDPRFACRAAYRAAPPRGAPADAFMVGDLSGRTDWSGFLAGADVVIHLAGRAHVTVETEAEPADAFRRINVEGTENLARQAARAGVRRFVFVSSVKVLGEETAPGAPFRFDDPPAPQDEYGRSKLAAEERLKAVCGETGMEFAIVRPPLVYGPGVKANFRALLRLADTPLPLPLGGIENRRSLIALANLGDLILTCAVHGHAAGGTFLGSDAESLSTSALMRRLRGHMGRPARLFTVPAAALSGAARLAGKADAVTKLLGSLELDIAQTQERLGWTPPVPADAALAQCVRDFREERR